MRLAASFHNPSSADQLSTYLSGCGIENRVTVSVDNDWGSDNYGTTTCEVWVIDEDAWSRAVDMVSRWQHTHRPTPTPTVTTPMLEEEKAAAQGIASARPQPMGFVTFYLLALCTALFVASVVSEPSLPDPRPRLPLTPLVSAPIKKLLFYDYPHAFVLVDELVEMYGITALQEPKKLSIQGQQLFNEVSDTPWWNGFYPIAVNYFRGLPYEEDLHVPMWEKERQGELWRLFTPILLHGDLFHLLFNMLWLIALGRQLELRIGSGRYLLFIATVALVSNTAQYLMTGSNFLGFSGVLSGMLVFIWLRQQQAPWEGYQLQPSTFWLLFLFIGAMASLQLLSFVVEASTGYTLSPGLANTAHLAGAFTGYLLSKVPQLIGRFS